MQLACRTFLASWLILQRVEKRFVFQEKVSALLTLDTGGYWDKKVGLS
jgi:hypothetical protein